MITNKVKAVTFPKFDIDRCIYADALKPHLRIFVSRMPELKVNGHDLRTCLLESIRRASYDLLHFPVDLEQVEVGSISDPAALQGLLHELRELSETVVQAQGVPRIVLSHQLRYRSTILNSPRYGAVTAVGMCRSPCIGTAYTRYRSDRSLKSYTAAP